MELSTVSNFSVYIIILIWLVLGNFQIPEVTIKAAMFDCFFVNFSKSLVSEYDIFTMHIILFSEAINQSK